MAACEPSPIRALPPTTRRPRIVPSLPYTTPPQRARPRGTYTARRVSADIDRRVGRKGVADHRSREEKRRSQITTQLSHRPPPARGCCAADDATRAFVYGGLVEPSPPPAVSPNSPPPAKVRARLFYVLIKTSLLLVSPPCENAHERNTTARRNAGNGCRPNSLARERRPDIDRKFPYVTVR